MDKNVKAIEKVLVRKWVDVKSRAIAETAVAMGIAVSAPLFLAHTPNNQFIVGTIVNAVLFWTAYRVGLVNAVMIAAVPSLIAVFRGMLPPTAAVMIPFIIFGNISLIIAFTLIKGSLLKRVFLSSFVKTLAIFLPVWIGLNIAPMVKLMMSWPQFVTALAGGVAVIGLSKFIGKHKKGVESP